MNVQKTISFDLVVYIISCHPNSNHYTCEATEYSNDALKYKCTRSVGPDSHHSKTFWAFIEYRLRIVTVAEILRLDPQEIPEDIVLRTLCEMMSPKRLLYTFMEKIPKPESWSYIDSQIPNWSKEWETKVLADKKKAAQVRAAGEPQPDA